MNNYYLKFQDQAELETTLLNTEIATEIDGHFISSFPLDVIGVIYKPTGKLITTDEIDYPELSLIAGWHANMKANLTVEQEEALSTFIVVEPVTPYRVWAGE